MRITKHLKSGLTVALAGILLSAVPASVTLAQLAKPDGILSEGDVLPHETPLNFLAPCSQCHVAFDQWAESLYEIKKPTTVTTQDFQAVRDLQWQLAQKLAIPCTGSCGHPTNYQIHPVSGQPCTLCHAKFLEGKHTGIDMTINEYDPFLSCGTALCHDGKGHTDLKKFGEKIPFWTMAFAEVSEDPVAAATALADLLSRTQQFAAPDMAPPAPIAQLAKAEGKWKHEIKSRLGSIVNSDLLPVAELLEDNVAILTAVMSPDLIAGTLEGKVEAKTAGADGKGNAELRTYIVEYDKSLNAIQDLLKETLMESKYKPAHPAGAMDFFIAEVTKRFFTPKQIKAGEAVPAELTLETVVWNLVGGGQIVGEFKAEETKITFKNMQSNSANNRFTAYLTALSVLSQLDKAYPETPLTEAKYAHTYTGIEDARWAIADAINAYVATLPEKELKYELKGAKDTETAADIGALMPVKVSQHTGEKILKLKSEIKIKYDKPLEPEVKAEAAAAAAE
ncbi:MAG: cytochrome c3 family protein [Chromatiaceae bacterium]|nr:cytochrome c3 family protein [Chromatiaceae bacterium]MBP6733403.1 cytochrome c3 family protein [Chromatiaceae bacterium]MBP6806838.1 cytochrome c3 family protein [Chromatiaceae bacterium]MBP8283702.1 cytochrome c3 family protein [Chromatiaceae bacterium]MBP8288495.1 cytochrome c3 family protein [Chromatiaceae bacterium]